MNKSRERSSESPIASALRVVRVRTQNGSPRNCHGFVSYGKSLPASTGSWRSFGNKRASRGGTGQGRANEPGPGAQGGGVQNGDVQVPWQSARDLLNQLQRENRLESLGRETDGFNPGRSAPGTEPWKQDFAKWDDLKVQVAASLERAERTAADRLRSQQANDRLNAGATQAVPEAIAAWWRSTTVPPAPWPNNMQFAIALPWWTLLLVAAAAGVVAWACYAGAIVALPMRRRAVLTTLRALTLLLLVACLLRPVRVMPPDSSSDVVVPMLVDVSRSMGLADVNGRRRIDAARDLFDRQVLPALAGRFVPELWTFGDSTRTRRRFCVSARMPRAATSQERCGHCESDIASARLRRSSSCRMEATPEHRMRRPSMDAGAVPVYAIGVGAPRVASDLEVLDVSAGEMAVTDSSVDISVAAVNRGGAAPFDLRVLENGRPIDIRRVVPAADGGPVRAVFTVSPPRDAATLYTVEIPSLPGERVLENNRRSVLVEPAGRRAGC